MPLHTVLIANRGEIAVRIARAARDLGIRSVAVYSEPDADALHTRIADEAWALKGSTGAQTYMNISALLDIAARVGADCVHPGYGFLSENADFARAVADAGMTWVGPPPETIDTLGDKMAARQLAESVGAPLAPGTSEPLQSWEEAHAFAVEHGLPVVIKAAFGGGGRGLKIVTHEDGLDAVEDAFLSAGREAGEAFGRSECFVEKFLERPRHVEAQVLADTHGNVAVVGLRDCSTQRRFQKLVEEAPAPFLTPGQTGQITEGARSICTAAGYVGAGTVEFIVAGEGGATGEGTVSFLEVNTRVQVEHPVTEVTCGVDIVAEQFRIAAGEELSWVAAGGSLDPVASGHAIEFRINAEDVANGFVPCPGTVTEFRVPTGPGIRVDAGVVSGSTVPRFYDSLLGKLIIWGPTREIALSRSRAALDEFAISGVRTVLPFHRDHVRNPAFTAVATGGSAESTGSAGEFGICTDWVDSHYVPGAATGGGNGDIEDAYLERTEISVEIDGRLHRVGLPVGVLGAVTGGADARSAAPAAAESSAASTVSFPAASSPAASSPAASSVSGTPVTSPFDGTVVEWKVADGAEVSKGQTIVTVEAMKMERAVTAPADGVLSISVAAGEHAGRGAVLGAVG
ncbi:ATP-binding protein [Corynebacterium terpenotabidum]|uniref:biotin carboxylase n=1 Tax=Corynebacterium terpenotabidum Y-11 TaxID=1200352 RepID=S4XAN3_9CORY|nr:biotin carboxylase N-terminal domain-containing protein [Corynebacterium terpenotabidum]AGP30202.1 acyl-CoA carboxylase subunit alpha [Corynebacterium terpenotabidum Y-11]